MKHSDFPQWRDGWHAHKAGIAVDDNPYNPITQQASNALWLSGWCERFGIRKHSEPGERRLDKLDDIYGGYDGD